MIYNNSTEIIQQERTVIEIKEKNEDVHKEVEIRKRKSEEMSRLVGELRQRLKTIEALIADNCREKEKSFEECYRE